MPPLTSAANANTRKKNRRFRQRRLAIVVPTRAFIVHKVATSKLDHSTDFNGYDCERATLATYYAMTHGLQILQLGASGIVASVIEFIPYSDMSTAEYQDLQCVIQFLMLVRKAQLNVANNGPHKAAGNPGTMSSIGWRVAMTFGEKIGALQ